jgi:hypothetical protein
VRGSPTAQNLSVARLVGSIAKGSSLTSLAARGIDAAAVQGVASLLHLPEEFAEFGMMAVAGGHGRGPTQAFLARSRAAASEQVRGLLTQALADPAFAKLLLEEASGKSLRRFAAYAEGHPSLMDALRPAASGAANIAGQVDERQARAE